VGRPRVWHLVARREASDWMRHLGLAWGFGSGKEGRPVGMHGGAELIKDARAAV
jgi:hypothetical protein